MLLPPPLHKNTECIEIYSGPTSQQTELKGSVNEKLVPNITVHLQRSCAVHGNRSELFRWHKGNLHNTTACGTMEVRKALAYLY